MARSKKPKLKKCSSIKKNGTKSSDRRVSGRQITNRMSASEDSDFQMSTDSKIENATNVSSSEKQPVKRRNRTESQKNPSKESSVDRSEEDHNGESLQREQSNKDESPSVTSEDEENYVVENIIDFKIKDDKLYFLIRWEGYDASADSWGEQTSLNCPELVAKFYEQHPDSRIAISRWKRKYDCDYDISSSDSNCDLATIKKSRSSRRSGKKSVRMTEYSSSDEETESEMDTDEVDAAPKVRRPVGRPKNNTVTKKPSSAIKRVVGRPRKRHDESENEESYEVEDIIDFGVEDNIKYFLIRWKGCDSSVDSWERQRSINCPEILAKFYEKHPEAQVSVTKYVQSKKQYTKSDSDVDYDYESCNSDYGPTSYELDKISNYQRTSKLKKGKSAGRGRPKKNVEARVSSSTKQKSAGRPKAKANNTSDEESQGDTEESESEADHNSQPELKKGKSVGRGRPKKRVEARVSSSTKKRSAGWPKAKANNTSDEESLGDTEESESEADHNSQPELKKGKSVGRGRPKKSVKASVSSSTKKRSVGRPKAKANNTSDEESQGGTEESESEADNNSLIVVRNLS